MNELEMHNVCCSLQSRRIPDRNI